MNIKHMSWMTFLCFSMLAVVENTYAAYPGLYLGGQAGWGNVSDTGISQQDMGDLITTSIDTGNFTIQSFNGTNNGNGLAGRVFIGYQYGCLAAAEFGWTKFNSLPVKANATLFDHKANLPGSASASGTMHISAFDFVGKGIVPLPYNFNVYGKLGLAYLQAWSNASAAVTERLVVAPPPGSATTNSSTGNIGDDITSRFFPTFGVGLAYDVRPDIEFDLSYNRIQKIGSSPELGSTDFISLGIALHFDKYGVYT